MSSIVSDEPFFAHPSWLSQLRLRSAYGASGVQPGPTDAMIQYASQTSNIASLPGTVSASDTPGLLATALVIDNCGRNGPPNSKAASRRACSTAA